MALVARDNREGGRFRTIAAALLTGGASRRMGRGKAGIEIVGIPVAMRLSRTLSDLFDEVLLVGGDPPPGAFGRPVPDVAGPRCALRGLVSALCATECERVLVVATDLPFMTSDVLLALVAWPEADAVVPRDANGPHPLCALYRREAVLARARENLAANRLALRDLLDGITTTYIEGDDLVCVDSDGRALTNVDTPEDLDRLPT